MPSTCAASFLSRLLACIVVLVALVVVVEPVAGSVREESVTYANDGLTLAAALLLPDAEAPVPAAVILQGSGESDRSNAWARAIAEGLAQRGVAVLLTDKRGSGLSGGDWRTADLEDLAEDALAGAAYLEARPEIAADRVGLVGLSQGGHVAPLAAALAAPGQIRSVVAVSASATTLAEQTTHEMRNTFRQAGLPEEGVEKGMALQRLAEGYARRGEWEPYDAALKSAAESPLAPLAAGFPQSRDSWVWPWVRRVGSFDPIPYWQMLRVPILVVYGREDERDNVPVAESVRRLEAALEGREVPCEVRVFEDSGHALYDARADGPRVRDDFLDLAAAWLVATGQASP